VLIAAVRIAVPSPSERS